MKTLKFLIPIAAIALFAESCNSSGSNIELEYIYNAYIINAGSKGEADGSISTYNFDTNKCITDAYAASNGARLGANIADAAASPSGYMYVLTSNPAQIVSLAAISTTAAGSNTGQAIKELQKMGTTSEGLTNPQRCVVYATRLAAFLIVVNSGEAASKLAIYSAVSVAKTPLKSYDIGANAHGLALADNVLAVTADDGVTLYDISDGELYKKDTYLYKGDKDNFGAPYNIATITNDRFAVICKGRGVYIMNASSGKIVESLDIETGDTPIIASNYVPSSSSTPSPASGLAYAITTADGSKAYLDNGKLSGSAKELYSGSNITGLSFLENNEFYVMDGGEDGMIAEIMVYDKEDKPILRPLMVGINPIKAIFYPYAKEKVKTE